MEAFYNQKSKFGRALFVIENGELSITERIGRQRVERRIPLKDLHADIERGRERFPVYSLLHFLLAAAVAYGLPPLVRWLDFVDVALDVPVTEIYGWMFGVPLGILFLYRGLDGLRPTYFVQFRHRHGQPPVLIARDPRQAEAFERFVNQASRRIHDAEFS